MKVFGENCLLANMSLIKHMEITANLDSLPFLATCLTDILTENNRD